jgi:predicted kinase
MMQMPVVHLIEGPVASGKSTFARSLASAERGVHIALDQWFSTLFSPDRPTQNFVPWYLDRKDRLLHLIWDHCRRLLDAGANVILELGLIQEGPRIEFCRRVQEDGYDLIVHVLDAPIDVRRERVQRRNREHGATFSMIVPDHIFEMASHLWQSPGEIERSEFSVRFIENG